MVRFAPFPGIRYSQSPDLSDFASPPYDVISPDGRLALEARHPANSVRLDYPRDEHGTDRYVLAAERLSGWLADGTLLRDESPTLSVYRMTATDAAGHESVTTGVIGQLQLEAPGTGGILPHEQTTAKDKADRLSLLQSCRANLSPIWGLSMTPGVAELYTPVGAPHQVAVDDEGVRHELWVLTDPERIEAICSAIAASPVVVADGHHRFETALAYQAQRPVDDAGAAAIMALVVELSSDELEVRAIHRIVRTLQEGADLRQLFEATCDLAPIDTTRTPVDAALAFTLEAEGAMALVTSDGAWLARPRPGAIPEHLTLDSERFSHIVGPSAQVVFHHDVATVCGDVTSGDALGGVLLRPATVSQIRRVAEERTRMPAKTTFFWPKPRTGMVMRPLD